MIKWLAVACSAAFLFGCSTSSNENTSRKPDDTYRPSGFHAFINHGSGNNPTGLFKADSLYHLFYTTGTNELGHLSSTSLLEWHPQNSLPLSQEGYGIVLWDDLNTTGLNAPWNVILSRNNELYLSYSADGKEWIDYNNNPVLNADGKPALFWSTDLEQWILTLANDNTISIYTSDDLINWQNGSVHELTDEIESAQLLSSKGQWFILSNGESLKYQMGTFDGSIFTPTTKPTDIQGLNIGLGSILFDEEYPIMISRNNASDPQLPTFASPMAIEVSTDIRMKPSPTFEKMIVGKRRSTLDRLKTDGPSWYQFRIDQDFSQMEITLNDDASDLKITWDRNEQEIEIGGSALIGDVVSESFNSTYRGEELLINILIDHASVDIFINEGEYTTNLMTNPAPFFKQVQVKLDGEIYDARGILYDIGG